MASAGNPPTGYTPAPWEKITVTAVAVAIVSLVGWLVVRNQPFADPNLVVILRIIISLAVAVLGATIPGFLNVSWEGQGIAIRAAGALALFVVTYLLSPSVVKQKPESEESKEAEKAWHDLAYRELYKPNPEQLTRMLGKSNDSLLGFRAQGFLNLARESLLRGEHKECIDYSNEALALEPDFPWVYFVRAMAHQNLEEYEQAIADYSRVIEKVPRMGAAHSLRAICYHRLSRDPDACSDARALKEMGDGRLLRLLQATGHCK